MKKLWALLFLLLPALAQVEVPFWHSMDGPAGRLLAAFAQEFAAKDGRYRVLPQYVGAYRDGETKLVAALRSGAAPVLFQAELSFFPRLVAEGRALALDPYLNLERSFLEDLFEPAWNYGLLEGKRYGLPLNTSTPVLFYNLDAFRAKGLKAPRNWKEFEEAAKALTSRQAKGFIFVTDPQAWLFEAMVTSRGGNLVKDGKPNLTSKEALEALEMLDRLNRAGALSARSMAEATFAQLDFVRTKGMMVMASIANWPAAENFSFAFTLGVAPVPREPGGKVPMGGAQLVVLKGASEAQVRGPWSSGSTSWSPGTWPAGWRPATTSPCANRPSPSSRASTGRTPSARWPLSRSPTPRNGPRSPSSPPGPAFWPRLWRGA
jgi:sn-glycerol 3-phosphate transport system substrate-binding protein